MLTEALALAAKGLRVFPIRSNAKAPPLVDDFPTAATTDAQQIRQWWTRWPRANIGIGTNNMCVVDIDPKRGGLAELMILEAEHGPIDPTAMRVRTPSGGLHIYLRSGHPVANSASRVAPGIDIRGEGGYVLGPGSVVDGKTYEEIR